MDTITHGIVGALIGKAFFAGNPPPFSPGWTEKPVTPGRVAIISGVIGAIFPDVDVLYARFSHDPLFYLTHHRGITHSLLMLPVYAVVLAGLTYWIAHRIDWPAPKYGDLVLLYAVALGSHLFLDLITSYGIMLWSPIDHSRPAWDWVLIIDLTLTSLALLPQLAAWAFHKPKTAWKRALPTWFVCCGVAFGVVAVVQRIGVPITYFAAVAYCFGMSIYLVMPLRHAAWAGACGVQKWCRAGNGAAGDVCELRGHFCTVTGSPRWRSLRRIIACRRWTSPRCPCRRRWRDGPGSSPRRRVTIAWSLTSLSTPRWRSTIFRNPAPNNFITAARNLPDVADVFVVHALSVFSVQHGKRRSYRAHRRPAIPE